MEAICRVSLAAIINNYQFFQKRAGLTQIIPVVKANAYGHGAIEIVRHLAKELDVTLFAVATLEEARELATAFPHISILIFSRIFADELPQLPKMLF